MPADAREFLEGVVAELGSITASQAVEPAGNDQEFETIVVAADGRRFRLLAEEVPTAPQRFTYYLHDGHTFSERKEHLEGQGVRLGDAAWENMGRPFYEVALECEVAPDGTVSILSARQT